MKLKSITLTTGIFPPDIGGPASFIPILADRLTKKGINVTVITLSDEPQDDENLIYNVVRISRKIKKPLRDILVINAIVKSSKNSDLIFSNTLAFESAIASIICGKKLVQKVVGDIGWERANNSGRFKGNLEEYQVSTLDIKSRLTNAYRNFAIKFSSQIISPSKYLENIINSWGYTNKNLSVIYNSVEFTSANKVYDKTKFRFISVARLIPLKSIDTVIKTLARIDFDYEYIILGDGPTKDELISLSEEYNVNTHFIGNVSKKEVSNWLSSSDVFIQNSSHETMPHVVLESMFNDCPVIASNVGGTSEIVSDNINGLLFSYNNCNELLEKIYLIKENEELRSNLVLNGKKFTKKFADVEIMVGKYIEIIERII